MPAGDVEGLETAARDYLRQQLGDRAPQNLDLAGRFFEQPLDTEGAVAVFGFELATPPGKPGCSDPAATRHFVVVGETNPNYFPAYGLSPDDAYSLHLGTRFMLEMGLERIDIADEPPKFREAIAKFAQGCNPQARVGEAELVLLFGVDDQRLAVYRIDIEGRPYFCMGGDLPNGFYPADENPAQMFLRLHLGKVIREEARRGGEE